MRLTSRPRRCQSTGGLFRRAATAAIAAAMLLVCAGEASAQDGWGKWWLPDDYSVHGSSIDSLFVATFWITMVTFVLVEITLVVFLIKYRRRPERAKAHFTHGNTRLEMAWTLAPALILAVLAVWNKGVWDRFRFNPEAGTDKVARVLVIGQQFKWNVIYPGPDGKLGRYLIYPKPTDAKWPGGKKFANVDGPAQLPYDQAVKAINGYIDQQNPLGKDFDDPEGKDDDWQKQPGRDLVIPANRTIEVQLGSKDVIHDFFLPNFRVKLDAVPGMRGIVHFTATKTSLDRERETTREYTLDELEAALDRRENRELTVLIDADTPGAVKDPKKDEYLYQDTSGPKPATIIRDGKVLKKEIVAKLRAAGFTKVKAYQPGYWDIVCEELCGQGHYTMQGRLVVVNDEDYRKQFETPKGAAAQPKVALAE